MLSTLTFVNESVQRSYVKSIGADARAAACHKYAALSCLAAGCDWSDEGQESFACCKHGRELCRLPSRHYLNTLSIRCYGFIALFGNTKIFQSWYKYICR